LNLLAHGFIRRNRGRWQGGKGSRFHPNSLVRAVHGWIYKASETFYRMRADIGGDPENPDLKIAWKYLYTAKNTWLGPKQDLGTIGSTYNLMIRTSESS
jgi:hypothetical protein